MFFKTIRKNISYHFFFTNNISYWNIKNLFRVLIDSHTHNHIFILVFFESLKKEKMPSTLCLIGTFLSS